MAPATCPCEEPSGDTIRLVPLPLALAAKKGGWNTEAWHLAGSALRCWGHKSSLSSQGDGWCDWPNMPRSSDRLVQWTERHQANLRRPTGRGEHSSLQGGRCGAGRELPWVWILAWPSLLGDLGQFHNLTEPPFSCLYTGGGITYLSGGSGKLRNSEGQAPGRALHIDEFTTQELLFLLLADTTACLLVGYWYNSVKNFFPSKNLSSRF